MDDQDHLRLSAGFAIYPLRQPGSSPPPPRRDAPDFPGSQGFFDSEVARGAEPAAYSAADPVLAYVGNGGAAGDHAPSLDPLFSPYESVFPQKDADSTWNMPGSFHFAADAMDVDPPAPAFQFLEPQLRAEPSLEYQMGFDEAQTMANLGSLPATHNLETPSLASQGLDTPNLDHPAYADTPLRTDSYVSDSPGFQLQFQRAALAVPVAENLATTPTYSLLDADENVRVYAASVSAEPPHVPHKIDHRDSLSHRYSIQAAVNELSPLTTTTSFTPSLSSMNLTQPSFFSAQQFLRSLFDQPPVNRGLVDFYLRRKLSIESLNSGVMPPATSQRSIASYFHFMDRDRKLPLPQDGLPSWTRPPSQPRHSIRKIFRTNQPLPEPYAFHHSMEDFSHPMAFNNAIDEEDQAADAENAHKKTKRPKRGLFTRFKSTKGSEALDMKQDDSLRDELNDDSELQQQLSHRSDLSSREAKPNLLLSSTSRSNTNVLNADEEEPDYGALFSKVGKRRNIVGMKNKKKDVKLEEDAMKNIKLEDDATRTLGDRPLSSTENSADCTLSLSVPLSNQSFSSKDSVSQDGLPAQGTLGFANASKRILGSRLMKKKNTTSKVDAAPSDIVELDLKALDLPEDTKILPKTKAASKTRGRKEDKAADMEDLTKVYVCGYCSRRFKRQEHLKRHFRSLHTSEKPYDCPKCLKKFSRTDNLNQHLKVHKQEEEEQANAMFKDHEIKEELE